MEYITVYTTTDNSEVSVLKTLFEEEKIDYKIREQQQAKGQERSFEVAEKDRKAARELLHQTGFLRIGHSKTKRSTPARKWIFIFLAALVLILVAILISWFMTAP